MIESRDAGNKGRQRNVNIFMVLCDLLNWVSSVPIYHLENRVAFRLFRNKK